jgi:hypothetical protein
MSSPRKRGPIRRGLAVKETQFNDLALAADAGGYGSLSVVRPNSLMKVNTD